MADLITTVLAVANGVLEFVGISKGAFVGYVLLGGILFCAWNLWKKHFSQNGGGIFSPEVEAERARKSGDDLRAAEIYERLGDEERAIASYQKAKAYFQIGRIHENNRQWQQSAQYYKLAGNIEKATEMFQKGGEYLQAAEGYVFLKKFSLAAEMYEKGKHPKEAAVQYEKSGNLPKAAALYAQADLLEKAAETYETHFLKQRMGSAGLALAGHGETRGDQKEQARQSAYKSGRLYMQIKKYQKAVDILSAGEFLTEAAEAAEAGGDLEKAAQLYLSAKAFDKASKIYEKMGNAKQYFRIMGKRHREEGNAAEAAPAFEQGESWADAAEMYENIGEKVRAAAMYMKAGDYHRAGEIFLALGDTEQAALAFEHGGRFKEAGALYEKLAQPEKAATMYASAMNYYQAAVLFEQQGNVDEAISCLQKVDQQAKDYYPASLLLGKMLIAKGLTEAARERFQRIIAQDSLSSHNIEFYYQLALIYENDGEFEKAQNLYEKILADNFAYRDVQERNTVVKKKQKEASQASRLKEALRTDSATALQAIPSGGTNRYRILQKIGQGGMGVVYKAEDTLLKRTVAYKVLPSTIHDNKEMFNAFMQEARIAAGLNHPNIVTVYDTGSSGDEVFLTMVFVDGVSLKEYLDQHRVPLSDLIDMMQHICDGVAYAHSKEVIHRDIKPANIMLTRSQVVKITDFGLARILGETTGVRTTVKGTPLYMGPEQILGDKVDQQSDIYSLGCTFYRMVAGRPPFVQGDVFYHHLHTPPVPPSTHNPNIPERLDRLILKCLEKDKAKRYLTVADLLGDLDACAYAMSSA